MLDFIHDFNGWMMMPVGLLFLVLELWVFKHLLVERTVSGPRPAATAEDGEAGHRRPKPRFVSVIQMPMGR